MLTDEKGAVVVSVRAIAATSINTARVRTNASGDLQLKNRTTGLWHTIWIDNNESGDATLFHADNPGEA